MSPQDAAKITTSPLGKKAGAGKSASAARRRQSLRLSESQDDYIKHCKERFRDAYRRMFLSGGTPKNAIKLKCIDCVGQEDISARVKHCEIRICPLWRFRPYQDSPLLDP